MNLNKYQSDYENVKFMPTHYVIIQIFIGFSCLTEILLKKKKKVSAILDIYSMFIEFIFIRLHIENI